MTGQGSQRRAPFSADMDGQIHFVGAISPCHHKEIIEKANLAMGRVPISGKEIDCYRTRTKIWGLDLAVFVYISQKLLEGQIRRIQQNIKKLFSALDTLKKKIRLHVRQGPKRTRQTLEKRIRALIASHDLEDLIGWNLQELAEHAFDLTFGIDEDRFKRLQENCLGHRVLITNRHEWSEEEIISAYWGQAQVEYAFKTMKNPFHLALRPQYHWTDQKIEVHGFICLLAFLLSMVLYKRAMERSGFRGCPHTLLEKLSTIRLATFVETPSQKTKGRYKAVHRIEEMEEEIQALARGLDLVNKELKTNIPFSVYN
ncbi:MAG: hypothetical protein FJ123_15215 [Deltaproteobacteria bacterium]|nr:hypothetical protein [Deltaproteobacteria bacterium]